MSCNHPYKGFKTGIKTDNGKDELYLSMMDCDGSLVSVDLVRKKMKVDPTNAPHKVVNGQLYLSDPVNIPCGSCVACRIERAKEWKIRNCLELLEFPECYFITLTYDDSQLTFDDSGTAVLVKKDFQDFMKRLRRRIGFARYFACGEYGDLGGRPHFHCLLYGHLENFRLAGINKFNCKEIDEAWKKGIAVVEHVSPGNIAYVCGYVEKKFKADYESFPVKPFLMMSLKPSIGLTYFLKRFDRFEQDMHVYGPFSENKKRCSSKVPKAFRRKLEDLPWYEDWKKASMLAGEDIQETMKVVYQCLNSSELGFAQDRAMKEKLLKYRKGSIQ